MKRPWEGGGGGEVRGGGGGCVHPTSGAGPSDVTFDLPFFLSVSGDLWLFWAGKNGGAFLIDLSIAIVLIDYFPTRRVSPLRGILRGILWGFLGLVLSLLKRFQSLNHLVIPRDSFRWKFQLASAIESKFAMGRQFIMECNWIQWINEWISETQSTY